jgi:hypothetical protein
MSMVRWWVRVAVILPLLFAIPTARAEPSDRDAARVEGVALSAVDEPGKWWGALGAAICGVGAGLIRHQPAIGMNPYVLGATIGGCLLALIDSAT